MKQTAVEWLVKEINGVDTAVAYHYFKEKVKQAKEMENQQREKDFLAGNNCACMEHENIEDYFNKYIKSEEYEKKNNNNS